MKAYLKTTLTAALFFGCLLATQAAYADGECDSLKELKDSYNKAVSAEKAKMLIDAFRGYGGASMEWGCEGKNPMAEGAKKGWRRVGQRLGEEAEKKGNFYTGKSVHRDAKDSGAFEWFSAIENLADADRVMMKMVKSKSEDAETFMIALRHFKARKERSESLKKDYNYALDPAYLKELEAIASRNGNKALEKEEKAFIRKEYKAGELPPVAESMNQLKLAGRWLWLSFHFANPLLFDEEIYYKLNEKVITKRVNTIPEKIKGVVNRTEKRGDALYADDKEPLSLREAIEYYDIINNAEKIKKAKEKANRLGDAAFKNNDLVRAAAYYKIAGNEAKEREVEALQKEKGKKQVDEMLRDDERKKKFKKEQKDLEKELGM